jgi:hypothetical protein
MADLADHGLAFDERFTTARKGAPVARHGEEPLDCWIGWSSHYPISCSGPRAASQLTCAGGGSAAVNGNVRLAARRTRSRLRRDFAELVKVMHRFWPASMASCRGFHTIRFPASPVARKAIKLSTDLWRGTSRLWCAACESTPIRQADREVAAIKLMSEAGYGPKKPLNIRLAYSTSDNLKRIAVAIAAMWKKLGVNVELVQTEQKVFVAKLRQGDFEIGMRGWGAEYNDAREFLYAWQTSTQQNYGRFSNMDYDRLMDEAAVTSDQRKRAQLLEQAEQVVLRELPFLPLFFNVSKNLVSTRVKGWEDNLFNFVYLKNLSLEK